MTATNLDNALPILACPCPAHGKLQQQAGGLVAECCGRRYRIEDGVPVLLMDEATNAG